MKAAVVGLGATGARAARQLMNTPQVSDLVVWDEDRDRVQSVTDSLGPNAVARVMAPGIDPSDIAPPDVDVAVLAVGVGDHVPLARWFVDHGVSVVSVADAIDDVNGLLRLDDLAKQRRTRIVVGAGFSPGLSCLLARHASARFDEVDEIHVAKAGTGGPACARQHHRALGSEAVDWSNGSWARSPGGSGRQLMWFPDPIGALDCYRAALPDSILLHRSFPDVGRITARLSATRRDRLTARLPMLAPPHPEGGPGAVRAEVWGRRGEERSVLVYGAMDRPGIAAGAVAAVAAIWAVERAFLRPGAVGLADVREPAALLVELANRGLKASAFEGYL